MQFDSAHSSIVMLGDDIVVGKYNIADRADVLGELDASQSVLMPVYANYAFRESPYQVQLHLGKFQIDYRAPDLFPAGLLEAGMHAADVFKNDGIRAVGINLNIVLDPELVGESGVEFCLRHFLSDFNTWQEILSPDDGFSNSGRVNYRKDDVIYTIRFEPHYKSDKEKLFLDFNAHQAIEPPVTAAEALGRYDGVKDYIESILNRVLEGAK